MGPAPFPGRPEEWKTGATDRTSEDRRECRTRSSIILCRGGRCRRPCTNGCPHCPHGPGGLHAAGSLRRVPVLEQGRLRTLREGADGRNLIAASGAPGVDLHCQPGLPAVGPPVQRPRRGRHRWPAAAARGRRVRSTDARGRRLPQLRARPGRRAHGRPDSARRCTGLPALRSTTCLASSERACTLALHAGTARIRTSPTNSGAHPRLCPAHRAASPLREGSASPAEESTSSMPRPSPGWPRTHSGRVTDSACVAEDADHRPIRPLPAGTRP